VRLDGIKEGREKIRERKEDDERGPAGRGGEKKKKKGGTGRGKKNGVKPTRSEV